MNYLASHINRESESECLMCDYLTYRTSLKQSPGTIRNCAISLKRFHSLLAERHISRFHNVTLDDLDAYRKHLQVSISPATVEQWLRMVRQFFFWLEKEQHIFVNPACEWIIPRPKRPLLDVPSVSQVKSLLQQPNLSTPVGMRDRAILELFYSAGLRLEELTQLTIFDINLQDRMVRVLGKGRKERVLPFGDSCCHWLKNYIKTTRPRLVVDGPDDGRLWIGCRGYKLKYQAIEVQIRNYGRKANLGISMSPHALRRAMATHMLRNGAHVLHLQFMLGHSSLATLSQYLRLSITDIKAMHEKSKPGK